MNHFKKCTIILLNKYNKICFIKYSLLLYKRLKEKREAVNDYFVSKFLSFLLCLNLYFGLFKRPTAAAELTTVFIIRIRKLYSTYSNIPLISILVFLNLINFQSNYL